MLRLIGRLCVVGVAGVALIGLVPPAAQPLSPASVEGPPDVRGAIHIHSIKSDGTGTIDVITQSASRAGLRFVVVTDHGDGTSPPDSPEYRNGVLYLDGVEISTNDGHVLALGLARTPYPLGGDARDVLEDIQRLGGFAIVAHPDSPKAELSWTEWQGAFGGIEWLNGDSAWRDERWWTMARALIVYPFRAPQALALLLDRPIEALRRWDALTMQRPLVAIVGTDAHSRIGLRTIGEPYDQRGSLHFPSYEQLFREFSVSAPGLVLTGEAAVDGQRLLDAIRSGHVYSTIDALAGPARLRFTAIGSGGTVGMGDTAEGSQLTLRVAVQAPTSARIVLLKDGVPIATAGEPVLEMAVTESPATYRAEISLPGAPGQPPVPWMLSNPIYVGRREQAPERPSAASPPRRTQTVYRRGPADDWIVEKSPASDGAIDVVNTLEGSQLLLRFALSGTASDHPYAAFVVPVTEAIRDHDRLVFSARADRPMRLSVQLRAPGGPDGRRWRRSVYLDESPRLIDLPFREFRAVGDASGTPDLPAIRSLLFAVDTVNTQVGTNGQIWLHDIQYANEGPADTDVITSGR